MVHAAPHRPSASSLEVPEVHTRLTSDQVRGDLCGTQHRALSVLDEVQRFSECGVEDRASLWVIHSSLIVHKAVLQPAEASILEFNHLHSMYMHDFMLQHP